MTEFIDGGGFHYDVDPGKPRGPYKARYADGSIHMVDVSLEEREIEAAMTRIRLARTKYAVTPLGVRVPVGFEDSPGMNTPDDLPGNRPLLSPEDSQILHDFIVKHERADMLEFDMDTHLPSRAIYHSPVYDWIKQRKAFFAELARHPLDDDE